MSSEAMKEFIRFSDIFRIYAQQGGVANPNATTMQAMQSLFLNWSDTIYQIIQHFWQPQKSYQLNQVVWSPSMPSGTIAICTKAGTSNGTEPTWPTLVNGTVNDGSAVWKLVEEAPQALPANGGTAALANNAEKLGNQLPSYYATAAAVNAKAPLASPTFTGTPKAPTAAAGTSSTQIATTAFVMQAIAALTTQGKIVAYNLAQNGYVKWDIGLIIQWGKYQSGGGSDRNVTITFPIAFAQYCYAITFGSIQYSAFPDKLTLVQSISKSNVLVHFDDYCAGAYYIIIGK
nr:MAG TPA: Baseplate wedge protein [Caudoviricetes sp.]